MASVEHDEFHDEIESPSMHSGLENDEESRELEMAPLTGGDDKDDDTMGGVVHSIPSTKAKSWKIEDIFL